jgi:hypothetical protein
MVFLPWRNVNRERLPSITALNVVFLASGQTLWESVISGALIVESIDKSFAGFVAWLLMRLEQLADYFEETATAKS